MSTETMLFVLLGGVAVACGIAVLAGIMRRGSADRSPIEANPSTPRIVGEVRAGEEQALIHLVRVLELPSGRDDVAYGQIYLAGNEGAVLRLASRSEIGRGFAGEIRVRRGRRTSVVEYVVLRVPGDEALLKPIAALDERIAQALRSLDPSATIRRPAGRNGPFRGFTATTR